MGDAKYDDRETEPHCDRCGAPPGEACLDGCDCRECAATSADPAWEIESGEVIAWL